MQLAIAICVEIPNNVETEKFIVTGSSPDSSKITDAYYLDGRGYSILNNNDVGMKFGIFQYVGPNSVITNLTIGSKEHPYLLNKGGANLGLVIGTADKNVTLDNITGYFSIDNTKRNSAANQIGGLIGKLNSANTTIQNCHLFGNYQDTKSGDSSLFGGLIGNITAGTATVLNSSAEIEVKNSITKGSIGGIIGNATTKNTYYRIINSSSKITCNGNVTCTLGGIVGTSKVDTTKGISQLAFCSFTAPASVNLIGSTSGQAEDVVLITGEGKSFTMSMVAGASIRTSEPSGLRFRTRIAESEYNAIAAEENVTLSFGTLIAPKAYVEEADGLFTLAKLGNCTTEERPNTYVNVEFNPSEGWNKTENTADVVFYSMAGSLANIQDYSMSLCGRGYVTLTVNDLAYTLYADFDYAANCRSVKEVAIAALEHAEEDQYDADELAALNDFAENDGYHAEPLLTQLGLNYTQKLNGMSYVLRTEEDTFIVIDGGHAGQVRGVIL